MLRLPKTGVRGRPFAPARRLRGWLASWLQERRRGRATAMPAVPGAPQIVLVNDAGAVVQVDWLLGTGTITGQRIYRKVDGGAFALWQTVAANATTIQDPAVSSGHVYTYYVVAYNAAGDSAPSNQSNVLFGS